MRKGHSMTRQQSFRAASVAAVAIAALILSSAQTFARQGRRPRPRPARDAANAEQTRLTPHRVTLADGRSFELNLPEDFGISVAAQGLKRVRFMARSPDDRVFVTDMYNKTDNHRGVVYILDQFDQTTRRFKKVTKYMSDLHNPNRSEEHTS